MAIQSTPPIRKLVVLEEGLLLSMAKNPRYLKEFPFLKPLAQYAPTGGGCGGCRGANAQRSSLVNAAKQSVVSMGDDRKKLLKQLLNTHKIRLRLQQGRRSVEYTF